MLPKFQTYKLRIWAIMLKNFSISRPKGRLDRHCAQSCWVGYVDIFLHNQEFGSMGITFAVAALALRGQDRLEGHDMRYLRIYAGDDGGSRFEDVELPASPTHLVDGVPPLLVSGPFACTEVTFVEQPQDASDWQ